MSGLGEAFSLLDAYVEQRLLATNTPGVAIALTDGDGLLHASSHGYADLAAQIPVAAETLFEIGSVSKSFTAVALLQLRDEGRLDLHAPVARYLPWFYVPSRYEPVTLHHLLSHTAGIITGTDFSTEARYEAWALRETETAAPPGSFYHYSNVGYKVLGLVLEEVLGQEYARILQERVLDPLGMTCTEPVITHETRQRLAVGYVPYYDDRPPPVDQPIAQATWFETATADGSIASTAADMAAYLRLFLRGGCGPHGRLISGESFRLMIQPLVSLPEDEGEPGGFYGYGLDVSEVHEHTVVGHSGGMVGYQADIRADLDDGLGIAVLVNGPGDPGQVARYGLWLLRAARQGQELPAAPAEPDPAVVWNAADYAGTYRAGDKLFVLVALGDRLVLADDGEGTALHKRGEDRFYVPHPDFSRFPLRFGRVGGRAVEAFHGPHWYVNDRYDGPLGFDLPEEWRTYPGHYRSHNPWYTNFRVVLRKGALLLVKPGGDEEILTPLGDGVFRVGEDERSPEWIGFDTVLDDQALHANLSGCDYYRTFTP